jgi:quinol monooxygenase YgiN
VTESPDPPPELYIFARFHARPGQEDAVGAAMSEVIPHTRAESGCLNIHAFRSVRDPQLFYIHSHWINEAAFEIHAELPHTLRFIETVATLVDQPLEITRAELIG